MSSCLLGQAVSSQRPVVSPLAGDVVQVLLLCPHTRQYSVEISVARLHRHGHQGLQLQVPGTGIAVFTPVRGCGAPSVAWDITPLSLPRQSAPT